MLNHQASGLGRSTSARGRGTIRPREGAGHDGELGEEDVPDGLEPVVPDGVPWGGRRRRATGRPGDTCHVSWLRGGEGGGLRHREIVILRSDQLKKATLRQDESAQPPFELQQVNGFRKGGTAEGPIK